MVKDNSIITKKIGHKDRTKIHKYDLRSFTKRYHLPKDICEDSVKLKDIATKIYKKNHKIYLHKYFDNYQLIMKNDSIGYFKYDFRIIHGHDEMLFDRKKCIIIVHKAWTGNF